MANFNRQIYVETLEAIKAHGSLVVASKKLFLTRYGATQRVLVLEKRLGVRLVNRPPRGNGRGQQARVSLTGDGEEWLEENAGSAGKEKT